MSVYVRVNSEEDNNLLNQVKDISLSIGVVDEDQYSETISEDGVLPMFAEVAESLEYGDANANQNLIDPQTGNRVHISRIKPRPFLEPGVEEAIGSGIDEARNVFTFKSSIHSLGEKLVQNVLDKMASYDGDLTNQQYVRTFKKSNPYKRLERTGALKEHIKYKIS